MVTQCKRYSLAFNVLIVENLTSTLTCVGTTSRAASELCAVY